MFDSANTYSDHIGKLPKRLSDARRSGYAGTNWTGDTRHYYDVPFTDVNGTPNRARLRPSGEQTAQEFFQTPIGAPFFGSGSYGLDGVPQTADDPPFLFFDQMFRSHCDEWSTRARPNGSQNGRGNLDVLLLDPACNYDTIAAAADKPNPFRAGDFNPLTGQGGALRAPVPARSALRQHLRRAERVRPRRLLPELPAPAAAARRRHRALARRSSPARSWPGTTARASSSRRS